eukprot:scaffold6797_cov62-Cylindrotheca_fusiformis.AAC.4
MCWPRPLESKDPVRVCDGVNDFRHPVVLDGFSGPPLSIIKKTNIVEYPEEEERLGRNVYVGVGRDTFLETTFQPVLVEHEGKFDDREDVCQQVVSQSWKGNISGLNVARAMNRAVRGDDSVQLAGASLRNRSSVSGRN